MQNKLENFKVSFTTLIEGQIEEAEAVKYLATLRDTGFSADELTVAVSILRQKMTKVDLGSLDVLDTCGTGGDAKGTFNISTAASFVVAGAGIPVAKHGNRAVSSLAGSADVLSALGVKIDVPSEVMVRAVKEIGIGFFMAPLYHASLKNVAAIRKKLGTKSIFNILGPLLNPAGAKKQVIGVYSKELHNLMAQTLKNLGSTDVALVTGLDGLDELTLTGPSFITKLKEGSVTNETFDPKSVGYDYCELKDLGVGDATQNAKRLKLVLKGHSMPLDHCVHLNAALGILTYGKADNFLSALLLAQESVSSGRAYEKLESLIALTQE
ncbi:MAG: anthranilate phosphoribosyltransferase [uncultured bacterium]|nr:MAG: anthranilate phosphoribosyltransferase [uncultured bacterium]